MDSCKEQTVLVGVTVRTGELNAGPLRNSPPHDGGLGNSSVSDQVTTEYFSFEDLIPANIRNTIFPFTLRSDGNHWMW